MKVKILCGMLIGTLAWAGAATGATYTDAATNYAAGWTNGVNGGTGFGAWSIETDNGGTGWAGCGIWNSAGAGLLMGEAFGYVGKVGHVTIDRNFTQAMNVNDSFALDFGVNWDSDIGNKGFSLFANGVEVINVNHGGFPGPLTLNGANAITNYGTNTMRWTFTQVAADQIGVHATGRNGVETFSTTVTVANGYGYIGAMRFYSSGLAADAPDQRQSYFDNLTLIEEGTPPPEPTTLTLNASIWNPATLGDLAFELARQGAVSNDITLTSDNTNAVVVPASASFVDGSNTVSFTGSVVSLVAGDATIYATDLVSGARAEYTVRPVVPVLTISGPATLGALGATNYTLTRTASVGTNVVFSSSNTNVLTVAADLNFGAGEVVATFGAEAVAYGAATIVASNPATGTWTTYDVTVAAPSLTIFGLSRSWAGGDETYRVIRTGVVGDVVHLASSDVGAMTVPSTVNFLPGENVAVFEASALAAGTTVLTATNAEAAAAPVTVEVSTAPDFLAYDDASLYGGSWTTAPAHVSGFPAWTETLTPEVAGSFRGSFIGTSTVAPINESGATFGLYANYVGDAPATLPEAKLNRLFPAAMATGQTFSVDVGYDWSGGTKGFKLKGDYEGTAYDRFELFNSGANVWSCKFDGNDATIVPIWNGYVNGGFIGRVQVTCTAPNVFTVSVLREGEAAPIVMADVALSGVIDQVEFYDYNGGQGEAENFNFNRMWLTKAPGVASNPPIASITFIPATGNFTFEVPAGYTLATVYGADNALVGGDWNWLPLVLDTDYTVSGGVVTILTDAAARKIIRIGLTAD